MTGRLMLMQILTALTLSLTGVLLYAQPLLSVELPDVSLADTQSARILRLTAGDDLQQAIDQAESGDVIVLEPGATYWGPFVLKQHPGPEWITIMSADDGASTLPPKGVRVSPGDASAMAVLMSTTEAVIRAAPGAARYHFIGIQIQQGNRGVLPDHVAGTRRTITNLVELSHNTARLADIPQHIVFERCYLHGDEIYGTRRGIVMNGAHLAVIDSHLSGFKSTEDAQALAGWDGPGPFLIQNNYLEAAGENLMFGGADPTIQDLVPADIVIRGNHFSKPLSWYASHASYDQSNWTIKNLLELKNARRVLIDGNLFEYNWPQSQNGFAILFTVRNQDGNAPWSVVEDVSFTNNIVRHVASGINILGQDDIHPSKQTNGIRILNNLFYDVGGDWGSGRLLQLLNGPADIEISRNTALQSDAIMLLEGPAIPRVAINQNIFMHNATGIIGTDAAPGQHTIDSYFSEPITIEDNWLIGPGNASYSSGMTRIRNIRRVPFANPDINDYRLNSSAPGVNFDDLCKALSITEQPVYCQP